MSVITTIIPSCRCGSHEATASGFQPRDVPGGFILMECLQCGQRIGLIHPRIAHDAYRGGRFVGHERHAAPEEGVQQD